MPRMSGINVRYGPRFPFSRPCVCVAMLCVAMLSRSKTSRKASRMSPQKCTKPRERKKSEIAGAADDVVSGGPRAGLGARRRARGAFRFREKS